MHRSAGDDAAVSARVTILLPARDAAATLAACLQSVRRQTERHFCCLVVDDGSRDETATLCEDLIRRDARFALLRRPRDGLVAALQAGMQQIETPFVARMDADDVMHPERIRLQVEALDAASDVSLLGCHTRPFPRYSHGEGTRTYTDWLASMQDERDVRRNRFVESPLLHPTWLGRTQVLRDYGYRQGSFPEDYDLLLRLSGDGHSLGIVPRVLHAWRRGPTTATAVDPRYSHEAFWRLKAHHLAAGPLRQCEDYLLWGYGGTGKAMRRALLEHGKRPSTIVEVHPGRLYNRIHGAPVVPPEALGRPPEPGEPPLLASVADAAARSIVRGHLSRLGWREDEHYWTVA
jgi:glycosyltransferase involved in cell wall biosynthesis